MNRKTLAFVVAGLVVGCVLTACWSKRPSVIESTANGEPGDRQGVAPPEVKKGVLVEVAYCDNRREQLVVDEVRGHWVLMADPADKAKTWWVNFDTLKFYHFPK